MNSDYHQTITQLENDHASRDYIIGWASGYLGNPKLEEQRVTAAWSAGYDDGSEKHTENAGNWKQS